MTLIELLCNKKRGKTKTELPAHPQQRAIHSMQNTSGMMEEVAEAPGSVITYLGSIRLELSVPVWAFFFSLFQGEGKRVGWAMIILGPAAVELYGSCAQDKSPVLRKDAAPQPMGMSQRLPSLGMPGSGDASGMMTHQVHSMLTPRCSSDGPLTTVLITAADARAVHHLREGALLLCVGGS